MGNRIYKDFDLVIEQVGDKYRARVVGSPAGEAAVEFDIPIDRKDLEIFSLKMGRLPAGARGIDSPEMEAAKKLGTDLFRSVFKDDVYTCYSRSLDKVLRERQGLRIRLRIDVDKFHDLPWEYLYHPQVKQFLNLSLDTPIIRYIDLPFGAQVDPVKAPVKILVMISSPEGYPKLDVEEEWRRLNRALQPLIDSGQVILQRLERPTLNALQQYLRREQVHVFHFIGHGKYYKDKQEGMLLLEDDDDHLGKAVSGQRLGTLLHDHHTLRLAVLNACEGARSAAEDPYAGVAQMLVLQGIPAVVAMQFVIFEKAAVTLAQEFYRAIADGYPVDAALAEARKAIYTSDNDVEWGTPVLFMRVSNGVLFHPQAPVEKARAEQATRDKAEREAAEKAQEERLAELNRLQNEAKWARQAQLDGLYNRAVEKMARKDWAAATEILEMLEESEPGYQDVNDLLERSRVEQGITEQPPSLLEKVKPRSKPTNLPK